MSSFAAGATTSLVRGGHVSVVQVATDAFGNALGSSLAAANLSGDSQSAGPGLQLKPSTAATWGPQYGFDDTTAPTDYGLAGGASVRLGTGDSGYTGGQDFAADTSQRRSDLATQNAAAFARTSQSQVFDNSMLLGAGVAGEVYRTPDGGSVGVGKTGIQNIGSITATRFALDDLPAQYQSAYGPVRLAHDAVGQGYLAVPVDDQGTMRFFSPPAGYEVPNVATLQAKQWGAGLMAGAMGAPAAARDVFEAAADFFDGAFNPNAQAQSPITQGIRDGRITGSSVLYGLLESSPAGIITNVGIGTPESLYSAGQATGGAAVFGAAGVTASAGLRLSTRVGASVGDASLSTGAKLSFDTSLNAVDRTFGKDAGSILSNNWVGRASYARLQAQGTDVLFVSDPGMREMGLFNPYGNTVTVNLLRHTSADDVASTIVHESVHQNRFFEGGIAPTTQYEEYLAFRHEYLFTEGSRPSLMERQQIMQRVQDLYPHLPSGKNPFGGQ